MASMSFAIVLVTLCLATGLEASSYTSCYPDKNPIELRVHGCSEPVCILYVGDVVSAELDFQLTADTETLKTHGTTYLGPVGMPYYIGQKDACESLVNAECPLHKGDVVTYNMTIPVYWGYHTMTAEIELALKSDDGSKQVCFRLPVKMRIEE